VLSSDRVLTVAPFWSGTPFELLVIPLAHHGHLETASDEDIAAVGTALRDALALARATLGDIAYNVVLHSAPYRHDGLFHWHAHVWPKLVSIAGFERGTGVLINITPPELAAEELRRALVR
jgi:UDPglucose--hexose-1-phosphate uridylyltransferase